MEAGSLDVWNKVELPWFFDKIDEEALPSPEEIRACTDILHERYNAKIVAVNERLVVKYGLAVDESEGHTMLYLEQHVPKVPTSRLYAMFYDSSELFLIMQRVPGEQLDKLWPDLTHVEKDCIIAQLRTIFEELRSARCPKPNYFGSITGQGVNYHLFYNQISGDPPFLGPFDGEEALVKGLIDKLRASRERNGRPTYKARFYEDYLGDVLRGHRPTLTHGDVTRRNIVVARREGSEFSPSTCSFGVCLLDWEMAGWLPDYWEYFAASMEFNLNGPDDDWCWYVGKFLNVCLAEAATMRMLDKDMR